MKKFSIGSKSRLLGSSVSALALAVTVAGGTLSAAHAANYVAGTESELLNAIASANNDGDASSTITLTGNVSIAGDKLPEVTKTLTIDIGNNILTSAGPVPAR